MTTYNADAERVTLELTSGDDETLRITKQDQTGAAEDITGWTFWLTVKENRGDSDADAVLQKVVTSHTDPANGTTEFAVSSGDTESLDGVYHYDMQFKTAGGTIQTFLLGDFYVEPDITEAS